VGRKIAIGCGGAVVAVMLLVAGLVLGYASWWVCFRWRGLVLAR